ncbi:E3 ubiquitin-protein ligase RNF220-like [Argiope bruennichi]|uniref:E3 ubiquitin-protein ligase RNF220-like n=1 Tax=Argiope bruennichi TaxID=94029 RepID=UPI002493E038|nr:E3 ubiquitin-protein ligase RNF220-like [Argiope bruennichi]
MEMQSDLTLELEKETVTDKSKYITDSSDSSILSTMKHKSIPDMEIDRIEPLTNGLNKILADSELLEDCTRSAENSTEAMDIPEVQNDASNNSDNTEQCQKDSECDCSRDSTSNSHCQCEEENQSKVPASPGSMESPNDSPDASRFDEIINVDLRRTRRNSKRKKDSDLCCPICSLTLRLPELESHFNQEVEKLSKINKTQRKPKQDDSDGINTTFVQVRSNRLNRLTAKVNEYTENLKNGINCPSCKLWICGTTEELNNHVLVCFQTIESNEHINVEDDEDDNESFEEYEFGDQTRIRAISFVPGGYRSLQGQIAKRSRVDEDEDLDVDVDDTIAFGQPQYSELDVIRDKNEEDKASDQLRKAVLVDPSIQPHVLESRKWTTNDDVSDSQVNSSEVSSASRDDKNDDKQPAEQNDTVSGHIISSLKEKIRDLGDQSKNVKCLICMEPYTKPVVSTTCWHVHCEECWLMTLGVKKLCPQCNMIVFPTDLRKIYL